jgi:hypothetical protein
VDGQPVESGKPLPLLMRLGKANRPDMIAERRDGTPQDITRTLPGLRAPGPRDPMADDAPGWRRDWWR